MVISSAYRLDRYFVSSSLFKTGGLKEKYKVVFFFYNKRARNEFLRIGIALTVLAYGLMGISSIIFGVGLVSQNGDLQFVSSVVSFILVAFATIMIMIEMIIFFIKEIREGKINE
ncbi:MAG: hypothetical protein PHY42_06705 [Bacilli bacterium]|nr:hypothetical protein [Bacilli bacterium]